MSEETLLTAARRMVRFLNIDDAHGGFLSVESLMARDTLDKQVRAEELRRKNVTLHETLHEPDLKPEENRATP